MIRVPAAVVGAALLSIAAFAGGAARADAQDTAQRFEITAVGDTTFQFAVPNAPWVMEGQQGIAVDPRRRDGLVARFRVMSVANGIADALILGQTQKVTTEHIALVTPPAPRFYSRWSFWSGLAAGLLGGFALGKWL